jgi:undecaprenyl phosphate N,N'-diacetylbacillosamine 1-phosphate transferase
MQLAIKRMLDIVLAVPAILTLIPVLAVLVAWIHLESPGSAIYRQRRLGRYGRIFTMYKLRSMRTNCEVALNADGSTCVVRNDPRVTWIGKYMRKIGLDELPQLFNVLIGDMSLVGPRPDQDFHLQWYETSDLRKLAMRPGITSLGQVRGRNAIPWKQRMIWEIEYVEQFSLWLDLKIAVRTFGVVLSGIGVCNPSPLSDVAPPAATSAESSRSKLTPVGTD